MTAHAADCKRPGEQHSACPVGYITITPSPEMRAAVLSAAGLVNQLAAPRGLGAVAVLDQLGARWSPDFDAYAAGELPAVAVRCVLCGRAPCECPAASDRPVWVNVCGRSGCVITSDHVHGLSAAGLVDRAAEQRCASCGGRLDWLGGDFGACVDCGDEWACERCERAPCECVISPSSGGAS